jgi:hypothetical protein
VWFRRRAPLADPEDEARLARLLLRLDPWAFWSVALEPGAGASFAVLGVTGAFVVAPCGLEGYLVAEGRHLLVDGVRVGGFREVVRAGRALRGKLIGIGASTEQVTPLIVLTRAHAGGPREHAGVRVLRPDDVVPTITARDHVLDPSTAERLAGRLGPPLTRPGPDGPEA